MAFLRNSLPKDLETLHLPSFLEKHNREYVLRKTMNIRFNDSVPCSFYFSRVFACPPSCQQKVTTEEIISSNKYNSPNLLSEYFWNRYMRISYRYHDDEKKKLIRFMTFTPLTEILSSSILDKEMKKIKICRHSKQLQDIIGNIIINTLELHSTYARLKHPG